MRKIETTHIWRVNDIDIFYTNETNGGGNGIGEDYFNIIDGLYGDRVFENALEWCSGPGFIGFGLLGAGICNRITLNDIYQPALDVAEITKLKNTKYTDKISIYQGSTIEGIPETEKFDLVVANPPHFYSTGMAAAVLGLVDQGIRVTGHQEEILVDKNWQAHTNFYNSIKKRLAPNGIILIQENQAGSPNRAGNFVQMIENAGLRIVREISSLEHYDPTTSMQIYYIEVKHK